MRSIGLRVLTCAMLVWAAAGAAEPGRMTGVDGKPYDPARTGPGCWDVLVFVLQDCPICNGYAPEIQRIAKDYSGKGVRVFLVHVDPELSDAKAAEWAKAYGYSLPVLVDREHRLVNSFRVAAVPTAVVIGPDGRVAYAGRIDDRYFSLGKSREKATTRDLRDALEASLAGKPVAVRETRVVGCAVPDLPTTRPAKGD